MSSLMDQLSPSLFWDAPLGSVDSEKHAHQVIERVASRGTLAEWKAIRAHYGDHKLREILTSLRDLSPRTMAFCCAALDLKKEDFRCYTARPFPPAPWTY
jgi:hypothetical protein